MLTKRDLEIMSAMAAAGRNRDREDRPRRGCLPGCSAPLVLFFICGLPFDLLILAKLVGLIK